MRQRRRGYGSFCLVLLLTGCVGTGQSIAVETTDGGQFLAGAACVLSNESGAWFVLTPGSVTVHKGYEALTVSCQKAGYRRAVARVTSATDYGAFLVDGVGQSVASGAGWAYPKIITIPMTREAQALP
ncbi:hypothetical protein [Acidisoma sp. 7E03]